MQSEAGTLFIVSTPIGNLGDISPRALETLRGVETIYAEDTRRTQGLTHHFGIGARLASLHAHNERSRIDEVTTQLRDGNNCALVSDAGTPGVSDPGASLVRAIADDGFSVVAIPGASAVLTALAVSGFPSDQFLFLGFPPRKGRHRREWLNRVAAADVAVVAFESPHRLADLLADMSGTGIGETSACVCRELTKLHEETRRGTVTALADYYDGETVRGEVTIVIDRPAGPADRERGGELAAARVEAARLIDAGVSTREIARALREQYGLARNEAYDTALSAGRPGAEEGVDE
ncbi:MAG: 16S rRNA (cytidine(1402)-2'-O)-methyltransferase [Gemmatimonadota bacterium]